MFSSVLVANRGEIALRVMRTAKAMGLRTIAVYSDADRHAWHVAAADEAVHIGGAAAADSYLRIEAIIEAARRTGAEAIHPGYGFLSERAAFAEACAAAGIVFVGPPPAAIRAMGLKDAAKEIVGKAGVPVVPGYQGDDQSVETLTRETARIGYPVLIKAVAGGGGKGMRKVESEADFAKALEGAQREARAAFGDDRVLVEKFVTNPRHVEVQVFADAHGHAIHLFERDCSLQRRHQKVIEEAPAPGMTEETRTAMGEAAVQAAKAIGYRGAGTVEFIADGTGGLRPDGFFFMEMNTRLQVEHPVTEAITGLDLVELQFRVAAGERLPPQSAIALDGHAVEARLYAEDPAKNFLPSIGTLRRLGLPSSGVRIDAGVREGDAVTMFYDPMIAKVIAHGGTREEARARLIKALRDTVVLGPTTNRHFLIRLLEHAEFAAGEATTAFLGRHTFPAPALSERHWQLAAQLLWQDSARRYPAPLRGWRNSNPEPTPIKLAAGETVRTIGITGGPETEVPYLIDGGDIVVDLDAFTVRFTDRTYAPPAAAAAGSDGKLRAPMDGKIVAIKVAAGEKVSRGQTLVVLEAMKIQHQLKAGVDAEIEAVSVQEGQQVANRTVLVTMRA